MEVDDHDVRAGSGPSAAGDAVRVDTRSRRRGMTTEGEDVAEGDANNGRSITTERGGRDGTAEAEGKTRSREVENGDDGEKDVPAGEFGDARKEGNRPARGGPGGKRATPKGIRGEEEEPTEERETKSGGDAGKNPASVQEGNPQDAGDSEVVELPPAAIRAVALLLIRHALEDTFGKAAVDVREGCGEIILKTDGARARLRVDVLPRNDVIGLDRGDPLHGREAAWKCEVVQCVKGDGVRGQEVEYVQLRSQLSTLVERLRLAVSKS